MILFYFFRSDASFEKTDRSTRFDIQYSWFFESRVCVLCQWWQSPFYVIERILGCVVMDYEAQLLLIGRTGIETLHKLYFYSPKHSGF